MEATNLPGCPRLSPPLCALAPTFKLQSIEASPVSSNNAHGIRSKLSKFAFLRQTRGLLAQPSLPCTTQNALFCDLVAFALLGDML